MKIITIKKITSKEVNTRFGAKPAYSAQGDDGTWYSLGFTKPGFAEGDTIEVDVTDDKYGKKFDPKAARKSSSAPSSGGASAAPSRVPSSARPFPIPPLHGDRAIVRQNSLTNAVNLLKDGLDKKLTEAQKAEQVIAVARMFEAYSCGDLDMVMAAEMAKKDEEELF